MDEDRSAQRYWALSRPLSHCQISRVTRRLMGGCVENGTRGCHDLEYILLGWSWWRNPEPGTVVLLGNPIMIAGTCASPVLLFLGEPDCGLGICWAAAWSLERAAEWSLRRMDPAEWRLRLW